VAGVVNEELGIDPEASVPERAASGEETPRPPDKLSDRRVLTFIMTDAECDRFLAARARLPLQQRLPRQIKILQGGVGGERVQLRPRLGAAPYGQQLGDRVRQVPARQPLHGPTAGLQITVCRRGRTARRAGASDANTGCAGTGPP
jgi:hypothetical protein